MKTDGWTYNIPEAEWPYMSCCYFGFACADRAVLQPEWREECLTEMRWLIEARQRPRLSGFITDHFGPPFGPGPITPSCFVHGLFLNLAIRYRAVSHDRRFDVVIHRVASALNNAYSHTDQSIIKSYKTMWWLSDNCPALSALARYDQLFHREYSRSCAGFITSIKTHYLDKDTGMFATYVNADARQSLQGPRGISVMYGLHFLRDIDRAFAIQQYTLACRHFVRTGMGLAAVREHPEGVNGVGDVDSGPLVLGFGPSASGFAIAAAAIMGDRETAKELIRASVLAGAPELRNGKLRYCSMPTVGQTVILFGKTTLLRSQPK